MTQINFRAKISDYTNRVLGVIKEKYGLHTKSEALDKFTKMFGEEFVDLEPKEKFVKSIIKSCDEHIKKHGFKRMTKEEFDRLFTES